MSTRSAYAPAPRAGSPGWDSHPTGRDRLIIYAARSPGPQAGLAFTVKPYGGTGGRYDAEQTIVALTVPDREALLWALDDAPDQLTELHGVLLREHT